MILSLEGHQQGPKGHPGRGWGGCATEGTCPGQCGCETVCHSGREGPNPLLVLFLTVWAYPLPPNLSTWDNGIQTLLQVLKGKSKHCFPLFSNMYKSGQLPGAAHPRSAPARRRRHGAVLALSHLRQEGFARKIVDRSIRPLPAQCGGREISSGSSRHGRGFLCSGMWRSAELEGSVLQCKWTKLFHFEHLAGPQHGRTTMNVYLHSLLASPVSIRTFLYTRHAVSYCISASGWKIPAKGDISSINFFIPS